MLVRWNPFRELGTLQEEMNRLFEGFTRRNLPTEAGAVWSPVADIIEDENNYVLKAELPGFKKEEVEVQIENRTLTLRGERKLEKEVKEETYHQIERSYGRFVRSFTLPTSIEAEKITAEFKDGVLQVVMPKAEGAKPKLIPVSSN
jgi:HSP20 family protein